MDNSWATQAQSRPEREQNFRVFGIGTERRCQVSFIFLVLTLSKFPET